MGRQWDGGLACWIPTWMWSLSVDNGITDYVLPGNRYTVSLLREVRRRTRAHEAMVHHLEARRPTGTLSVRHCAALVVCIVLVVYCSLCALAPVGTVCAVLTINGPLVDDSFSVRGTCKRRSQTDTAGVRRDDRRFFVLKIRRYLVFPSCNNILLSELFHDERVQCSVTTGLRSSLIPRCPSAISHCIGTGVAIRRKIRVRVPHLQLAIHTRTSLSVFEMSVAVSFYLGVITPALVPARALRRRRYLTYSIREIFWGKMSVLELWC